jgi:hypothetical protein
MITYLYHLCQLVFYAVIIPCGALFAYSPKGVFLRKSANSYTTKVVFFEIRGKRTVFEVSWQAQYAGERGNHEG